MIFCAITGRRHAEKIFARSLLLTGCANVECLVGLDVHTLLTTTGSISFDDGAVFVVWPASAPV